MAKLQLVLFLVVLTNICRIESLPIKESTEETRPKLQIIQPLNANFSRKTGERLRLSCSFKLVPSTVSYNKKDLTIYWVKNYQELMQNKKGKVTVVQRDMSTVLVLRRLEAFDSGSYMCIAELSLESGTLLLNSSSETTLLVKQPDLQRKPSMADIDINDYLLSDIDSDNDLNFEDFPQLNPTIVENFDDKGFCEPYRGSICSGIISSNYSIYSTSAQQQDLIEERLRSIIPYLSDPSKNNLSKRCSTFAIPSLCLFAFPICDESNKQPKQICRSDCNQLQEDICKDEYFNVKSLFSNGLQSANKQLNEQFQASSNFLLDCNQLPPSSDSPKDCLPIVTVTLNKLEEQISNKFNPHNNINKPEQVEKIPKSHDTCVNGNGIDYRGTQQYTRNGFKCQRWDSQFPNKHRFGHIPELTGHNYCRNLDNDIEPWCYTTDPNYPRDYCAIPKCTLLETALKNLPNTMAVLIPGCVFLFIIILLIVLYCRCCRQSMNQEDDKSLKNSMNSVPTVTVLSQNGSVNTHLQNNRLRMSNASLGKSKKYRAGSSKSSVASSQAKDQMNPFLKNYENDAAFQNNQLLQFTQQQQFQQMPMPMPPFQQQSQQENHQQVKQISPQNIRLLQEIGKGRFGSVYTGELVGNFGTGANSVVKATIKTLKPSLKAHKFEENNIPTSTPNINNKFANDATDAAAHFNEQEFYNEISLYSSIRNRNLANLIGIFTTNYQKPDHDEQDEHDEFDSNINHPQCMIFEHLNNGDLHEYLLQRAQSVNSVAIYNGMMGSQSNLSAVSSSIGGVSSNYLNLQQQQRNVADFLYIGQQIASGMEYLSSQNFILKDLATRNILMADNLTIKISIDLVAQYKEQYAKDYYKFQMKMLPVRWMPPESLLYGRYNQQSDVWSFGVCLWEIFNYGGQPYAGCTNPEAIEMIRDRQLLLIPDDCPQRAYALMLECWHELPMQRPTFTDILNRLRNWENYYIFNNNNPQTQQQQLPLMPPPPLPLPLHLQQQPGQQVPQGFGMTTSYSSNSQNSKASSQGNTASTSASGSPPPLPAPLQMPHHVLGNGGTFSPSKSNQFGNQASTNMFMSKFNANGNTNSLRMSQRNYQMPATFNNIPAVPQQMDINYEL